MKTIKLLVLTAIVAVSANTQIAFAQDSKADEKQSFTTVEKMPEFPGGREAMFQFIGENIVYPKWEKDKNIQGKVFASFVVDENGKVGKAKILKSIEGSKNIDTEVLRVIGLFPDWIPGEQRGKKVAVQYTLPVAFKL